eukprot:CAMPEP_0113690502 /NCGR_PEP_ID=MMETSP0038_2-20120614/17827_1 /TAXON_ID=2898 /ORGANISM="Cryptomonas paramecium" /LENGTH=212 /DNA_ID=CAMNT_0000611835 /DNA_START=15 /DNA_END=649 /DNA_ORIENTATION=- /assembly_acc=CAM_ASM_000170
MPLFKFGMLLVRTLSKPVANAIKQRAVERPSFKKLCIDFAQAWNRFEIRLNLGLVGHSARVIKPLDEATAVKSGAEILGEGVVFTIAAIVLFAENRRAAASEARKSANIKAQFDNQTKRIQELESAVESLRVDVLELLKHNLSVDELQKRLQDEENRKFRVYLNSKLRLDEGFWASIGSFLGLEEQEHHPPPAPLALELPPPPPDAAPAKPA